nr:glucocorticoid modulatory element-binding protein 1-like isoform X2 [Peromyscus maniculatus bairdii]
MTKFAPIPAGAPSSTSSSAAREPPCQASRQVWCRPPPRPMVGGNITQIAISEESMEEAGLEWNSALTAAVTMATEEGIKKESEEISEDTLMFWKGIADVGLMEEVVCNIQKEIEELLRGVQQRLLQAPFQVTDAAVLNNVAHTFGLMDTVKRVLDNRRKQVEQGEGQFLYTLAGTWACACLACCWRVDVSLGILIISGSWWQETPSAFLLFHC